MKTIIASWCAACMLLLALAGSADAAGGFFITVGAEPNHPAQRAIIVFDNNTERLILKSKYKGEIQDFAWIIPIPALICASDVTAFNEDMFTRVHEYTQPIIRIRKEATDDGGGIGCNGAAAVLGGGMLIGGGCAKSMKEVALTGRVNIWTEMTVGPYEIAILSASNSSDLVDWLNTNGYIFPPDGLQAVDFYVNKNWYFVAVKVTPQGALLSEEEYGLPTLSIKFPTDELVYPMVMSSGSNNTLTMVTLNIITDHKMEPAGWSVNEFDFQNLSEVTKDWTYEDFFAELDNDTFILEFSDFITAAELGAGFENLFNGTKFITRYSINIHTDQMTDDFFFVQAAADDRFRFADTVYLAGFDSGRTPFRVPPPAAGGDAGLALVFLGFLALIILLRLINRRKRMLSGVRANRMSG